MELPEMKPSDVALVVHRNHDVFALEAIEAGGTPSAVIKHLVNNLSDGFGSLTANALAELTEMEKNAELTSTQTKKVLGELVRQGGNPEEIAINLGFEAVGSSEIENLVEQLIKEHPEEWKRFCGGEKKIQGFFVGQVMKATDGQAEGKLINQILNERSKAN